MTTTSKKEHPSPNEPSAGLPKAYNPADHEDRIRLRWESAGAFHADPKKVLSGEKPPYCVLIPPPNVTGALHLGHALNNTLQDILVRMHRMKGYETLWMPGSDHAGIATQTVVEKRILAEGGKPRIQWDRDEFIARVQEWKDEYEARITNQLTLMGSSCDWDRQRFTMDEVCAKAVREAFFQLFKAGLIERGKRLVNWDPVTQTALADDEVDMIEVEGAFYYMRYPLCDEAGEPTTATFPDGKQVKTITVATTRPETYLGDTAVAVNPDDPRAPTLRGLFVKLPLVGRIIPIIEDDYVVLPDPDGSDPKAKYATGFLKVTPAHDENDWLIGQRHELEAINVLAPDASISDQHGWTDVGDAAIFVGLSREDAREKVVKEFESRGLLEEVKPYVHSVGHSYRSHAMIEPYLSDQWYVKVTDDRLVGRAQRALASTQQSGNSKWLKNQQEPSGVAQLSELCAAPPTSQHWSALLNEQTTPAINPEGFIGRDPFPPGEPAPADLMGSIRNLPHIELPDATYFVTWRTANDITLDASDRQRMLAALRHFDGERCRLYGATVLDNHVHCLVKPLEDTTLSSWVQSVKKFSSREINAAHERTGQLWQDERFDHVVRHAGWFARLLRYIVENPVKARLVTSPGQYDATFVHDVVWNAIAGNSERGETEKKVRTTNTQLGELCHPGEERHSGSDGGVSIYPERYAKTYEAWHENLRDWCISRQLWWGHRIPIWTTAHVMTSPDDTFWADFSRWEKEERLVNHPYTRMVKDYEQTKEYEVTTYMVCVRDADDREVIESLQSHQFAQDPDVLDTWFSSALWPLSTMGWPDPAQDEQFTGLLEAFKPTNVLCTARDIITLWVSRMVMFNRFFTSDGQVPFHHVYIHPVIQDGDGKRMSKSAGNGVDPLDIIHTHGTDAMRYTLCQLASQTQDVRMPIVHDEKTGRNTSPKFDLGKRLCNKLWNASRFTMMMLAESNDARTDGRDARPTVSELQQADLPLVDRWMLSRLAHAVERIESALDRYEFNVYTDIVYDLLWNEFCDWHLEAIKPTVKGNADQQCVLRSVLDCLLRLLHPVAPFVTEAIYEELRRSRPLPAPAGLTLGDSDLLCLAPWPTIDPSWRDAEVESQFAQLQGLIGAIREARSQHKVLPKQRITLHTTGAMLGQIESAGGIVETLAGLEAVTSHEPDADSTPFTHNGVEHRLSGMSEQMDASTLRDSLKKSLSEVDSAIALLDKRLSNPGYTDKAPAKLVQQTRDQLHDKKAERDAIAASLAKL